jgi:hypothetical protein
MELPFVIERTGEDRAWAWLSGRPSPPGMPAALFAFVRAENTRPFRVGSSDAAAARRWIEAMWPHGGAPVRVAPFDA